MKMPVSWHQECLVNQKRNLINEELWLRSITSRIEGLRESVAFRELQINQAMKQGKTEFDSERFLKSPVKIKML